MTTDAQPMSARYAVAVAVGPGDREVERVVDLIASIAAHEPTGGCVVMVDDSPEPRDLGRLSAGHSGLRCVGLHHPRHGRPVTFRSGKGICAAVLMALGWIQANTDAPLALKLDTDSLVIGPFVDRLANLFAADAAIGIAGAHTRTPNGTVREVTHHGKRLRELSRPSFDWRHPVRSLRQRYSPEAQRVAGLLRDADRHGYAIAEHCMGGGYAVSRPLLDALAAADRFAAAPDWVNVDLPEDVMLGLHARAAGFRLVNCVDRGDVFGVRYQGLPFPPAELVERGYAVIHAVKNDPTVDEATIRAFFAERRRTTSR